MPDILANGEFGRDDGVKCECGSSTFLVDDQGAGLKGYECSDDNNVGCERTFQVQYDSEDEPPDPEYDPAWDDEIDPIEFNQPEDSVLDD